MLHLELETKYVHTKWGSNIIIILTYSYAPVSCLNECLCIACWAACSQDIMLRVLFSQQISPSIQYNLNYIPLFHYSVLYPLLCWAFSPYYTLQVHIFFVVYIPILFYHKQKHMSLLYCQFSVSAVNLGSQYFFVFSTYCTSKGQMISEYIFFTNKKIEKFLS